MRYTPFFAGFLLRRRGDGNHAGIGSSEKSRGTDCVDFSKWIFMIRILEYRGVKRKTEMILFSAFCGNLNPIYET